MQVPVYTQERRTDTFIYTTGQSALDGFSICFWMKGVNDDDDWQKDVLISFATPGNLEYQSYMNKCHESEVFVALLHREK